MKIINSNKMKFYILNTLIFAIIFLQLVTPSFSSLTFLKNISKINILDNNKAANFSNEKFSKEKSQELSGFSQFIKSFVLNFFSEIGDKSFLCIMFIYNQVSPCVLFVVACLAELLMNFLSVMIGYNLSDTISIKIFQLIGMISFTGFGILLLFEVFSESHENEKSHVAHTNQNENEINSWSYLKQIIKIAGMIFLAELGDKSQITTIILSTDHNPIWIFLGTALAHIIGVGISIFLGYLIANKCSSTTLTLIGAIAFILFGIEMAVKYFATSI